MAKIVMSGPQNVTLDGVVQDPDGERTPRSAAGSPGSAGRTWSRGRKSRSTRPWARRPGSWVGAATSSSVSGGAPGPDRWPTG